jgi:hypothetical protein
MFISKFKQIKITHSDEILLISTVSGGEKEVGQNITVMTPFDDVKWSSSFAYRMLHRLNKIKIAILKCMT